MDEKSVARIKNNEPKGDTEISAWIRYSTFKLDTAPNRKPFNESILDDAPTVKQGIAEILHSFDKSIPEEANGTVNRLYATVENSLKPDHEEALMILQDELGYKRPVAKRIKNRIFAKYTVGEDGLEGASEVYIRGLNKTLANKS